MPRKFAVNDKKAAGQERKAANAAKKLATVEREREQVNAAEWEKGSNTRGNARKEALAKKADEVAQKRREKEMLLKQEEEVNAGAQKVPKRSGGVKSKKKAKNDLSLLEEALVGDAEKKVKSAKKAERVRREREERLQLEKEKQKTAELNSMDPLLRNTEAMLGDAIREGVVREGSGGIDAALGSLSVGKVEDRHPEKRMKALHKAFEERMMPGMKNDYPGLKMSQYKERIFSLWQKSAENPKNCPQGDPKR